MKVILNQDVASLGEEGDVKDVAAGYARNYLLPKRLVMPYNAASLAELESRRAAIEARKEQKRKEAQSTRERLENEEIVVKMTAGERGRLFGSVTSATVVEHLESLGVTVDRKHVDIPGGTIKELGNFTVGVRLYGEEEARLKVRVEPDEKSAAQQQHGATQPAEEEPAERETPAQEAAQGSTVDVTAEERVDEEASPSADADDTAAGVQERE
jgi:large subunit ribosomal protein L9